MRRSEQFARQSRQHYTLLNNVFCPSAGMFQAITFDGGDEDGWEWSGAKSSTDSPCSYPHVLVGTRPWGDHHAHERLPSPARDAGDLVVNFDMEWALSADSKSNVAFDIWVMAGMPQPGMKTTQLVRAEIMVWYNAIGGVVPAGGSTAQNGNYAIWIADMNSVEMGTQWKYVAFRDPFTQQDGSIGENDFRIGAFIQDCIDRGFINPDDTIASIEFGTEIWRGSGRVAIHDYQLS